MTAPALTRAGQGRNNHGLTLASACREKELWQQPLKQRSSLLATTSTRAGLRLNLVAPRYFEDNLLLDSQDQTLLRQGAALRIRSVGGRGWVTYKGAVLESGSPVKLREEIEVETTDPDRFVELFERLGFRRAFRYQKYRTMYKLPLDGGDLQVVLDETPMGNFIEIEGDESAIMRVLEAAGFSATDIVRESYPELQASRCKARGVPLEDLVFK